MNSIIKIIGILVFAVVMYAVPILFTCSILLYWNPLLKLICLVCVALQFIALCSAIQEKAEDGET